MSKLNKEFADRIKDIPARRINEFPKEVSPLIMGHDVERDMKGILNVVTTEAKQDLQQMLNKEKERQELSFLNTGSGLWSNNDNVIVNIYIKWYNKWFGE